MFYYVLALFLINTNCRSSGNPVNKSAVKLGDSLTALAIHCKNSFLVGQINSKVTECNVLEPLYNEREFHCLIFYDINSQLCTAVGDSKLTLTDDKTLKLNDTLNVTGLCNVAKDWDLTNIKNPSYKKIFDKVFKNRYKCEKVCSVDDIMSEEVNFYCRYYMWGMEMFKNTTSLQSDIITANKATLVAVDNKSDSVLSQKSTSDHTKEHEPTIKSTPVNNAELAKDKINSPGIIDRESSSTQKLTNNAETTKKEQTKADIKIPTKEDKTIPSEIIGPVNDETDKKYLSTEEKPPNEIDIEKNKINTDDETKKLSDNNPELKEPLDTGDYSDSEEAKEGPNNIQGGDDSDDPVLGNLNVNPVQEQLNQHVKRIESPAPSFNGDSSQRDHASITIQDGYIEDDDHFFPLFLTAVVLVVLLYILYRNKNKVSKMFLGLIVEGRQPGRRRNSRGHAYRRLDTLEQAMSANTSAPPSKIIY